MRIGRVVFVLGNIPLLAITASLSHDAAYASGHLEGYPKKYLVIGCLLLWSSCLTAWRCHDYNKSAWSNFFTEQVPFIGPIVALWDLVSKPGDQGFNSYGAPSKF